MDIISKYVREELHYTKNELKELFSLDDLEFKKFINKLKIEGILKNVNKSKSKTSSLDLDEDEEDEDEDETTSDTGEYKFTYVGIIIYNGRVIKVFPKYISKDEPTLDEMKQILKVLEKYSTHKENISHTSNASEEIDDFNMLSTVLFLLKDYHEYGIYTNDKDTIELNGEGEILWQKTIDESFAYIQNNRPYYMELFTRKTIDDDLDYFKRLHECILTECSRQLNTAQLDTLFSLETLALSEETLQDFGDQDYILERISKELNVQFNTRKQILLKTLYAYILNDNDKKILETDNFITFGVRKYEHVWEKVCAEAFGNMLDTKLEKLPINLTNKYRERKNDKLIDIIEKPKWTTATTKPKSYYTKTLKPDLVIITKLNGKDAFIILDAKYYNIEFGEKKITGNPSLEDVTKQYLYQRAYCDFMKAHNISAVKNCFLMPTEGDSFEKKGTVTMSIFKLKHLKLEDIQIFQIPAKDLYEHYLSGKKFDINELKMFN